MDENNSGGKIHDQQLGKQSSIIEDIALFPDGADVLNKIIALLRKASGINFAEYKQLTIKRRIRRRMGLLKLDTLDNYLDYLRQNSAEVAALQQDMLINVTQFFREPQAFETLKNVIFPSVISAAAANLPIRLWVPGCSTGEEAYSLAISLLEFLEESNIDKRIQIFATDINEAVIEKARAGIYPKTIMSDVSLIRLSRFFVEMEQGYQVSKKIRDICVFARQDIGQDPPISRVDIVSCRNVMIYFGSVLHKRIFPIFHYALNPNGFLILGASESIGVFADLFDLVNKKYRIYTKKSVASPIVFDFSSAEQAASLQNSNRGEVDGLRNGSWMNVQKEADRIVLSKYAPPGVIINSQLDIIQFRGRTGVYLEPASGMPSVNLLKMARDGLFAGLRSAINQAKKENTLVKKDGLHVLKDGNSFPVNVEVVPLNGAFRKNEYFLVLFKDVVTQTLPGCIADSSIAIAAQKVFHQKRAADEVLRLQQEVAATKEYLQSIIDQHESANEDLRYAHEEVQSSNEELQSMNEEMETAKEELQSTNEELMTLNEELETRNQELNHVNNDMLNLFRSIKLPVLILSSELRIRRFNLPAGKVFNLISTDVGRPISNIKPNIDIPDLEQTSLQVIDTLNSIEQEVQDRWGQWYSMRIRPYRTTDNKIDGVMITFVDIDAMKHSSRAVQEAREYANAIVETVRHPMVLLDAELCLITANKAFCYTFRMTPGEVLGQSIFKIKDSQWNLLELRTRLTELLEQNKEFGDFVVTGDFANSGIVTIVINARQIVNLGENTKSILMVMETVVS